MSGVMVSVISSPMLAVVAMAFVTTGCKDGSDGLSATDLIVSQTANVWYRYGDTKQTVTTTDTTKYSGL